MALLALPSWPVTAYLFLVMAVIFALLFVLTFVVMSDGEGDIEEPTLNTRSNKGD